MYSVAMKPGEAAWLPASSWCCYEDEQAPGLSQLGMGRPELDLYGDPGDSTWGGTTSSQKESFRLMNSMTNMKLQGSACQDLRIISLLNCAALLPQICHAAPKLHPQLALEPDQAN